jgi:pyruvate dehydrogenase E1 component alpha subunit
MELSPEIYADLYSKMVTIRRFEEKAVELFSQGKVYGTAHFCIGEEAACTGVCAALEKGDRITQTHRSHGQGIAKGMDINKMMAEFLGRETGYCKGKGGSMHIAGFAEGSLGANGIVGGGIPIAAGSALSQKYLKQQNITVAFFGDGATNEGSFHESLNLASVWKLPVIFVCTNNFYAMSTHIKRSINIRDISQRASSYGIPGKTVDGNDVLAVYEETKALRSHALAEGPSLLVLNTYRWLGHSKSDAQIYRSSEEVNQWKEKCPIKRYRTFLLESKKISEAELENLDAEALNRVNEAVSFAEASPELPVSRIAEDVYA